MATTDHVLDSRFKKHYPKTRKHAQDLFSNTAKRLDGAGKKSFFTGVDKGEKYAIESIKSMYFLIESMQIEYVFTEHVKTYANINTVLNYFFEKFFIDIYPNWPVECRAILDWINNNHFNAQYKQLLDEVIAINKERPPHELNSKGELHALERLKSHALADKLGLPIPF